MTAKNLLHHENIQLAAVELNHRMLPVFLGLLLAAAVAWLFLSKRLNAELRQNHPGLYETLGRPRPWLNRRLTTNFRVIGYVFRQGYENTGDPALIRLCRGLRALLYIYILCLAGALLLLFDKII